MGRDVLLLDGTPSLRRGHRLLRAGCPTSENGPSSHPWAGRGRGLMSESLNGDRRPQQVIKKTPLGSGVHALRTRLTWKNEVLEKPWSPLPVPMPGEPAARRMTKPSRSPASSGRDGASRRPLPRGGKAGPEGRYRGVCTCISPCTCTPFLAGLPRTPARELPRRSR
jgi:hypothetical protein